jgi:hypothetical protein
MRSFALAIATLVMVSSCTHDPGPIEPTESAPPDQAPTEPTMPDSAKENTPSGAANFVDYWVSTFNYGAQTGIVEPMLSSAGACKPCRGYAKDFRSLPSNERATGEAWTITNVRVGPERNPIEVEADVRVLDEDEIYPLTFVLNSRVPFELVDIYERGKS